jgi:formylglycine-generating enzyme required for sulfatase activity
LSDPTDRFAARLGEDKILSRRVVVAGVELAPLQNLIPATPASPDAAQTAEPAEIDALEDEPGQALDAIEEEEDLPQKFLKAAERFFSTHGVGSVVNGKINWFTGAGVAVQIEEYVAGFCSFDNLSSEPPEVIRETFKPGTALRFKIIDFKLEPFRLDLSARAVIKDEVEKGDRLVSAALGNLGEDEVSQLASELVQMTAFEAMRLIGRTAFRWENNTLIFVDNYPASTIPTPDNPVTRLLRTAYERSLATIPLLNFALASATEELEEMRKRLRSSALTPATEKMFVELEDLDLFNRASDGLHNEFPDGILFKDFSEEAVSVVDTLRDFIHPFIKLSENLSTDNSAHSELYQSVLSGKRLIVILHGVSDVEAVRLLRPPEGNAFIIIKKTAQAGTAPTDSMTGREDLSGPAEIAEPTEAELRRRLQQLRQEHNSVVLEILAEERLQWSEPENVEYRDDPPHYSEFDSDRFNRLLKERSRLDEQIKDLQTQLGDEAEQAHEVIEDEKEKGSRIVAAALGELSEEEVGQLASELVQMIPLEALRLVNSTDYKWSGGNFIYIDPDLPNSSVSANDPVDNAVTHLLQTAYERRRATTPLAHFTHDPSPEEIQELRERILSSAMTSATEKAPVELEGRDQFDLAFSVTSRLRDEFPDGTLSKDFSKEETSITETLRDFIHPFIKLGESLSTDISALTERYQSILSDKRLVVILYGVRDIAEVSELRPPQGCAFISIKTAARRDPTSREDLIGSMNDKIRELMSIARRLRAAWELPMSQRDIEDWRELEYQYVEVAKEIDELDRQFPHLAPDNGMIKDVVIDNRKLPEQNRSQIEGHVSSFLDARLLGSEANEAIALDNLGQAFARLQEYRTAIEFFNRALKRIPRDTALYVQTLIRSSAAYTAMGEAQRGIELLEEAVRIAVEYNADDKGFMADLFYALADRCSEIGDHSRALDYYTNALRLYIELEDRPKQARAFEMIGESSIRLNRHEAVGVLDRALSIYQELGDRHSTARALERLVAAYEAVGEHERAVECAQMALNIFSELEAPDAERLRLILERLRRPRISLLVFETVTLDERGREVNRRKLTARQFVEDLGDGVMLEMVEIPGGKFLMGTSEEDSKKILEEHKRYGWSEEWIKHEMPQHEVTVPPFFIGKFAVTQKQWRTVADWEKVERDLDPDHSYFKNREDSDNRPVELVSWEDAKEFCARLSVKTGRLYRLPSEAEWEYTCRAGATTTFAFGETITHETVNYNSEYPFAKEKKRKSRGETIPVGSLGVANSFGLFDMHGNVREWCEDPWHGDYDGAPTDGSAWLSGGDPSFRVVRGGSWDNVGGVCRSADRFVSQPDDRAIDIGFRVVMAARTP